MSCEVSLCSVRETGAGVGAGRDSSVRRAAARRASSVKGLASRSSAAKPGGAKAAPSGSRPTTPGPPPWRENAPARVPAASTSALTSTRSGASDAAAWIA